MLIINKFIDFVLTYAVMMFFRSFHVPCSFYISVSYLWQRDLNIGRLYNRVCVLMTGYLFNIHNYMKCNNCETVQLSHANMFPRRLRHSSWDQAFSLDSRQLHSNCFMLRHTYHSISPRINSVSQLFYSQLSDDST